MLLVLLILVGALMPLKYTARLQLPKPRPARNGDEETGASPDDTAPRDD